MRTSRVVLASVTTAVVAVGTVTALTATSGTAAPNSPDTTLRDQLATILADPMLAGGVVDLTVRDLDTKQTLFDQHGSTRLSPASNTKLLTSTTALDVLGPSYRFTTSVRATGARRGHVLNGPLYLKGTGDPTTEVGDYEKLAADVARTGLRTVRGPIVADDTFFDDQRYAPFWNTADESDYYNAEISALTVAPYGDGDAGTVLVDVYPGKRVGAAPSVKVTPANKSLKIKNTATTGAKGSDETVSMVREHGKNVLDVTGSIPLGTDAYEDQPTVDDPTGLAAELFTKALAKHGIRWTGGLRRGATPAKSNVIATHDSIPLSRLLTLWLKLSNNMMAESVTKAMGQKTAREGTWDAGITAIRADLSKLGVDTSTIQMFDGSGLARADYVPSEQFVKLLAAVRSKSWFHTWYEALPIAGNPDRLVGGTLRSRMTGTAAANNVHAKTGSLTGVTGLSGYVTDKAGHHLAFSMLSNNFIADDVKSLEDKMAITLANHGGTQQSDRIAVRPVHRGGNPALECSWTNSC